MADKYNFDKNVLVVDDQETNLMVMDGILKYHYGIDADFANNGKEAVDMAARREYDLIFMDVDMPVMNGIDATRAIIRNNPNMPIIAVTSNGLDENKEACLKAGMLESLVKPIDLDELRKVIKLHLFR
jgi:CheY-like chemotaxis protein